MPIKIPEQLPARPILEGENIFVMTENRANRQDIRPLEIGIVNLMPTKIATIRNFAASSVKPSSSAVFANPAYISVHS